MLNLTRREKSVIGFLVLLYIAGCIIYFGRDLLSESSALANKDSIKVEFKKQAEKIDSLYFGDTTAKSEIAEAQPARFPVNINTASREEIITIKGIGPVTADKIIEYRTENGKFNSVSELTNIKGIGDKTLEKIKGEVTIE